MTTITSIRQLDSLINQGVLQVDPTAFSPSMARAMKAYVAGSTLMAEGHLERAAASYRQTLASWPDFVAPRTNLAHALHALGKSADALRELDLAHKYAPLDPDIHMSKASIYNNLQQHELALPELFRALDEYQDPSHLTVTFYLGVTYSELGRYAEARAYLLRSMMAVSNFIQSGQPSQDIQDHWYRVHLMLAEVCEQQEDWPFAVKHLQECLSMNPGDQDLAVRISRAEVEAQTAIETSAVFDHSDKTGFAFNCMAFDNQHNRICGALIAIDLNRGSTAFRCEFCRSVYFVDPAQRAKQHPTESISVMEVEGHWIEVYSGERIQRATTADQWYMNLLERKTGGNPPYFAVVLAPPQINTTDFEASPNIPSQVQKSAMFSKTRDYLNTQDSFPEGSFMFEFYELHLDEQIVLLKEFVDRMPQDSRAWKLLGLCYYWTMDNNFLDDGILSLTTCLELGIEGVPDAVQEFIAGCYLFKGNSRLAEEWFSKSQRFNGDFVKRTYGSLERYAQEQRGGNIGTRFRGYTTGRYSASDLRLRRDPDREPQPASPKVTAEATSSSKEKKRFGWFRR